MKSLKNISIGLATLLLATPVAALSVGANANADLNVSSSTEVKVDAKLQARMDTAKEHGDQEIDRRIQALTDLKTRVQAMVKLVGQQKDNITSSIQAEITSLTDLKGRIDSATDIEALKADIKSITTSYRIFMLVIPEAHITVTAEKLKNSADVAIALATKLSARIDEAGAAGKDVASLKKTLEDMQAKIADANVQADAAVALITNLTPDNGDKAKQASNNQALKDARAKIKLGMQDLVIARKDAGTIVKALAGMKLDASATSTTTATTTTP